MTEVGRNNANSVLPGEVRCQETPESCFLFLGYSAYKNGNQSDIPSNKSSHQSSRSLLSLQIENPKAGIIDLFGVRDLPLEYLSDIRKMHLNTMLIFVCRLIHVCKLIGGP